MGPIFASRRSSFSPLFIEGLLVVLLVYALGHLTVAFAPLNDGNWDWIQIGAAAIPLAASVSLARHTRRRISGTFTQELTLITAMAFLLAGVCALGFVAIGAESKGRLAATIMLEAAIAVPIATSAWRWLAQRLRLPGFTSERVLIIGIGDLARQTIDYISRKHEDDYSVVGFIGGANQVGLPAPRNAAPLYELQHLAGLSRKHVDRVVVALEEKRGQLPIRELIDLRLRGIQVEESTSFIERSNGKIHVESLLPSWLIFSDGFRISPFRAWLKRGVDLTLSTALLIVTLPAALITAVAIKLESKGPVFYTQVRTGLDGSPFTIYKFRSMIQDAEASGVPAWCGEDDPRITRVGSIIRKLRIDELPQIWNVFCGDMSFVGPRPERPHFVAKLDEELPYYSLRHAVRPGITGWAQVMYRYGASNEDALEKLKYDLFYVKNGSILLDLWISLQTVRVVLFGAGAR